jgi:hypothetical protein
MQTASVWQQWVCPDTLSKIAIRFRRAAEPSHPMTRYFFGASTLPSCAAVRDDYAKPALELSRDFRECLLWVKSGKPQPEQMILYLLAIADLDPRRC